MAPALESILQQCLANQLDHASAARHLQEINCSASQLEAAAKAYMFDLCENDTEDTQPILKLLLLILDCAEQSICGTDLALSMLEEAMDVHTIAGCDRLFAFLETHRKSITRDMGKGMPLLRLCNELLRRLSKTQDTVFCGRILIFLSLVFPLSERSAVNLKGEFNLDNVTAYEEEPSGEINLDMSTLPTQLQDDSPESIYARFWSLQAFFNYPADIVNSESQFSKFGSALDMVLDCFEKIQSAQPISTSATPGLSALSDEKQVVRAYFTPKVLTSHKLLGLEWADSSFRRHILIQALIVLDYLLALTQESKEQWAKGGQISNKSLINSYVLPTGQVSWVDLTRARVTTLLKSGRDGAHFLAVVQATLRRDQAWLRWKCEGCPAYDKSSMENARIVEAPKRLAMLTSARKAYPYAVGNAVLSRLWASAGGWSEAELQQGATMPTTEDYSKSILAIEEEIKDTLQDEELYELEDKRASKSWRALRLARFTHLDCFTGAVAGGKVEQFMQAKERKDPLDLPIDNKAETLVTGDLDQVETREDQVKFEGVSSKRPASETASSESGEKRQKMMETEQVQE